MGLVGRKNLQGTLEKDYFEQTEIIVSHLVNEVYKDRDVPEDVRGALEEFEKNKSKINFLRLQTGRGSELADVLAELKINQLFRETPIEAHYDIIMQFYKNGEKRTDASRSSRHTVNTQSMINIFIVEGEIVIASMAPGATAPGVGTIFTYKK